MTHRPAAPQLHMRDRNNPAAPPRTIRLRGGPIANGTDVYIGWDRNDLISLSFAGVRPEYINDFAHAVLEAGRNAIAEQEAAAS